MRLHRVIEHAAAVAPDAPALVFDDRTTSFGELWERTRTAAGRIRKVAAPGERIVIVSDNRPEVVELMYGASLAGVPAMFGNTRLTVDELADLVADVGPVALFGSGVEVARLSVPDHRLDTVRTAVCFDDDAGDVRYDRMASSVADEIVSDPDDVVWIIHTSGTTGLPKGACITHRSLLAAIANTAMSRPVADDDVYLFPFPLFHVAAYVMVHVHLRRRPVVLLEKFRDDEFCRAVDDHRVSAVSLAPTMIAMLLDSPHRERFDLSSLRTIAYGASAIPLEVLRRGLAELRCDFAQGYGMTELSGNAVFLGPGDHRRALDDAPELLTSAGRPGPLVAVSLADDAEVLVRGEQVIPRYWERPAATRDAFRGEWFRTGDVGRIDDGVLSIVDRHKDLIVTGGENVSSREVEDALSAHPDLAAVAAVGRPSDMWGEEVAAVVVPRPGRQVDPVEVAEWSRGRLAGFKRPRSVVVRSALPMTASGKVLKRILREELRNPDPTED